MEKAITACLLIVGLINFAPVVGVLAAQKMESAYAISLQSIELKILMRHRALLFGILGGFILFAAFTPLFQTAAMVMAFVSMVGFAVLVLGASEYNPEIKKVLIADIAGLVFLSIAVVLKYIVNVS